MVLSALTFDDISVVYLTSQKIRSTVEFASALDLVCTFFVVPDDFTSYAPTEFLENLKVALGCRHELALHGFMHVKNEFGVLYPVPLPIPYPTLKEQKRRLDEGKERFVRLLGIRPEGFRAPYYLHNNITRKALVALDFKYDSSTTIFKPTHCSHFRVRILRSFRPFIAEHIVEIPVAGDYTFNLNKYGFLNSMKIALRDFELAKSSGGVFVINCHPHRLGKREFHFLKILLKKIRSKSDFLRLKDIAKSAVK